MTIENLIKVVPPPAAPFEAFDGSWTPIEAQLGLVFPPDYKDFARLYGSGSFMEFVVIMVPWSSDGGAAFVRRTREACDAFRSSTSLPYPVWPSPGGLLPLGSTEDGDDIFCLPRRASESWSVVIWDRGGGEEGFETFDCDLTDFLAGLATGGVTPEAFPADFLACNHLFRPHVLYDARRA